MKSDPFGRPASRPTRRSIRLKGYDYSQSGAYFITLCTQGQVCLFGDVVDGKMRLNSLGQVVQEEWLQSEQMRLEIRLDEFIVMPNHVHGIVWITRDEMGANPIGTTERSNAVGRHGCAPNQEPNAVGQPLKSPDAVRAVSRPPLHTPHSLSSFIAGFKSKVTKRINLLRCLPGSPVWQRNYFEHIIRDDEPLNRIRQYIIDNPAKWKMDRENPVAVKPDSPGLWLD